MVKKVEEMDMAELWWWLYEHPVYVIHDSYKVDHHALEQALDVEFTKVDPVTGWIDREDKSKNTLVECWLEFGILYFPDFSKPEFSNCNENTPFVAHDIDLDCGGPTFEDAFRKLCGLILAKDGDYEREE